MKSLIYTDPMGREINEMKLRKLMRMWYGMDWHFNIGCNPIENAVDGICFPECFYINCGLLDETIVEKCNANSGFFYWCNDCEVYHVKTFSLN